MELKTKYQYSYFIYPYLVREENYTRYIQGLLKNKKCTIRFFEKERDYDIYKFFLPKMREYMFRNFEFTTQKIKKFKEFDIKTQAAILSKYPCTVFEYDMGENVQGKIDKQAEIFFKIQKIELICFMTGVCFVVLKTNLEDSNLFSELLDFNYKFSEINSELKDLKKYENIHIQTNQFADITKLSEIISELTGNSKKSHIMNIDTNRFYTFSYACLEQEYWNQNNDFSNIENEFNKYCSVSKNSNQLSLKTNNIKILENWEYAKIGISNYAVALLSSGANTNNYTKLPFDFENQYLYMYIWILYQKIYLNKIASEFNKPEKYKMTRKKFVDFTRKSLDT